MRTKLLGIILSLAVAFMAFGGMASANLVSTSFGFPVIVQNGTTSAFNQDTACATDYENVAINFPAYFDGLHLGASTLGLGVADADSTDGTASADSSAAASASGIADALGVGATVTSNVLPFGPVNLAFPDISQTVLQTQQVTHTDFAQTSEFAEFAYPFVGVGDVSLPGFGFGW